jgi:UDP-glucose 4-epimerase
MNVLITGGAGYIGSHAVSALIHTGHRVVVIDNLFRGHREAVHADAIFYQVDLRETDHIEELLKEHQIDCVMHFAALTYVGDSVENPLTYYQNNTSGTLSLLQAMKAARGKRIVFSSTCATYGEPEEMPIVETMSQNPINPYGHSKLFVEQILKDYVKSDQSFGFVSLRYFNVAGCAMDGSLGEDHTPETHLIPIVLQTALGLRDAITIFGTDYPTPDGTCIRDYIHVEDLCRAHIAAMENIRPGLAEFYNLGIGNGYSVKEIIESARRVTGADIPVVLGERRPGDPPVLFANPEKIQRNLGWSAQVNDLDEIISSAWNWFRQNPEGYKCLQEKATQDDTFTT